MSNTLYHQHVKIYKRNHPEKILFECSDCHVEYQKLKDKDGKNVEYAIIDGKTFYITRDNLEVDSYITARSWDINPFEHDTLPPSIDRKIPYGHRIA